MHSNAPAQRRSTHVCRQQMRSARRDRAPHLLDGAGAGAEQLCEGLRLLVFAEGGKGGQQVRVERDAEVFLFGGRADSATLERAGMGRVHARVAPALLQAASIWPSSVAGSTARRGQMHVSASIDEAVQHEPGSHVACRLSRKHRRQSRPASRSSRCWARTWPRACRPCTGPGRANLVRTAAGRRRVAARREQPVPSACGHGCCRRAPCSRSPTPGPKHRRRPVSPGPPTSPGVCQAPGRHPPPAALSRSSAGRGPPLGNDTLPRGGGPRCWTAACWWC